MFVEPFISQFKEGVEGLRSIVIRGKQAGIPIPAMNSALDYFDSFRAEDLPANLVQAQRDYFGAHTYQRRDKEGYYHTEWMEG